LISFTQKSIETKELLDLIPGNVCGLNDMGEITYVNASWKNSYRPGLVANFLGSVLVPIFLMNVLDGKLFQKNN
jgi:hypothetical protein